MLARTIDVSLRFLSRVGLESEKKCGRLLSVTNIRSTLEPEVAARTLRKVKIGEADRFLLVYNGQVVLHI